MYFPDFLSRQIWQIFEPYSLIDFLLYNLRIPTNKRIFYYVSYNNKLAYYLVSVVEGFKPPGSCCGGVVYLALAKAPPQGTQVTESRDEILCVKVALHNIRI
jgi:hypothetical protein